MIVLYAGLATPSETAGVGAILALLVIGVMYGVWRPSRLMPILTATMRESSMLLLIVGFSLLYAYVMSYLHIFAKRGRLADFGSGFRNGRFSLPCCCLSSCWASSFRRCRSS